MKTAITVIVLLAATAFADWPQFHRNSAHSGAAGEEVLNVGAFHQARKINLGSRITAGPVIRNNAVYVGTHQGIFYALRENSDSVLWQYRTRGKILSTAAATDSLIVVGGMDSTIYAFRKNGDMAWTLRSSGAVMSPVTYAEDRKVFYVGDQRGTLYAIDPSGGVNWTYLDTSIHARPEVGYGLAYDKGQLAVPYGDSRLHSLQDSGSTYSIRWIKGNVPFSSEPVIHKGHVYVGSFWVNDYGKIIILNMADGLNDGKLKTPGYSGAVNGALFSAIAADSNFNYFCPMFYQGPTAWKDSTGGIVAGFKTYWSLMSANHSLSGPALSRDHLIFQTEMGIVYLVNRWNGTVAYQDTFAAPQLKYGLRGSSSAPAISNGSVYFGADDGFLYCYTGGPAASRESVADGADDAGAPAVTPNPFNPSCFLAVHLSAASVVRLDVFDAAGHWIRTLQEGVLPPGTHRVNWDGRNQAGAVASGIYIFKAVVGKQVRTARAMMLK